MLAVNVYTYAATLIGVKGKQKTKTQHGSLSLSSNIALMPGDDEDEECFAKLLHSVSEAV